MNAYCAEITSAAGFFEDFQYMDIYNMIIKKPLAIGVIDILLINGIDLNHTFVLKNKYLL